MKNKKPLTLILIIILIIAIAPYFVGNMAKENIEKQAAHISQMPGYTLEIRDYDQGWFSSHVIISYGFDEHTLNIMKNSEDLDPAFFELLNKGVTLDVTVTHGPVTFQNGINFVLLTLSGEIQEIDHQAYRDFMAKANIDSLATTFVSVSYGGTTSIKVTSPPFKVDYSDIVGTKMVFDSAGIDMQGTINAAFDTYMVEGHLNKLAMEFEEGNMVFNEMDIHSNGNKINDFLWTGNGTTSMENFTIALKSFKDSDPKNFDFSVYNITSDYDLSKESDDALKLNFMLNMDKITTDEIELDEFQLSFSLNHLNLDAITYYVKSINEIYQPQNGEIPTPEQTAANIELIATQVGEKLVKGSPELIINNFNFLMGEGFYNSNGTVTINGEGLENIKQLSDPIIMNERLAAIAKVKFNKALAVILTEIGLKKQLADGGVDLKTIPAEQFNQMVNVQSSGALQAFITQGYIQMDGEDYSTHFNMKNGQILINGKPLPIPEL